ncbi:MAG: NAD(P)H nitroreductase [Bacteroidetes bacterium HGW-Bacteroidetes-21]|jgi:nitroreductase|nr:MAG: NAD(P)H nitroreductase [Bacteroidetes bacterium HGW-Bacteroidetes-21]
MQSSFLNLALLRQSCRKYIDSKVEQEKLDVILEAARLSPSASNSQPWTIVVVNDEAKCKMVAESTISGGIPINKFALQAPMFLVIVVEKARPITRLAGWIKGKDFEWTDMGIIAEHICLQAAELDLGSCMIGWFDEKRVKQVLNVPSNKRVGLVIALGYPPDDYHIRKKIRKSTDELVRYNTYSSIK